ncbi:hypothetical protein [Pseudomonas sp. UBA2684]|uniref:hypothetical protein n=1 Tax=Pseudomonas sp. UBA2684 TaxID=1947311 RepID=UPI0025CE4027|nr:hypothetical protein [Pseudomonas sp. UBA2684]|tara:strand:+ start:308 stop:571 length:264 start_codon:yes stop_codon:yes gene_type:complete
MIHVMSRQFEPVAMIGNALSVPDRPMEDLLFGLIFDLTFLETQNASCGCGAILTSDQKEGGQHLHTGRTPSVMSGCGGLQQSENRGA